MITKYFFRRSTRAIYFPFMNTKKKCRRKFISSLGSAILGFMPSCGEGEKSANAPHARAESMCNWDNRENTLQYGIATAFEKNGEPMPRSTRYN